MCCAVSADGEIAGNDRAEAGKPLNRYSKSVRTWEMIDLGA
jgi:hypothetical protein